MAGSIPVLDSQNKYKSPSSYYTSAALSYLLWTLGKKYFFQKLNSQF